MRMYVPISRLYPISLKSSPFAQEPHQRHPSNQSGPTNRRPDHAGLHHLAALQDPVPGQHPDDARIEQDTGGQGIQRRDGDHRGGVIAVERVQDPQADGHTQWGDDAVSGRHEDLGRERSGGLGGEAGNAGAEGETFEELVEEDDDEEGEVEGVAGYDEGEAED